MSVADITPEPNEPFAFLPVLTWYQTFYLTPPFIPIMAIVGLTLFRRTTLTPKEIVFVFSMGAPVGFVLWVTFWETGGAGTGRISPAVGTLAIVGWISWISASFACHVHGKRKTGRRLILGTSAVLCGVILSRGRGVAPLHLILLCGLLLELTVNVRRLPQRFFARAGGRLARAEKKVGKLSEVPIAATDQG